MQGVTILWPKIEVLSRETAVTAVNATETSQPLPCKPAPCMCLGHVCLGSGLSRSMA